MLMTTETRSAYLGIKANQTATVLNPPKTNPITTIPSNNKRRIIR
jgi:hypothetical protein